VGYVVVSSFRLKKKGEGPVERGEKRGCYLSKGNREAGGKEKKELFSLGISCKAKKKTKKRATEKKFGRGKKAGGV